MEIGLTVKQLRKLGGKSYTDKQIAKMGVGVCRSGIVEGNGCWSNAAILLLEQAPKGVETFELTAKQWHDFLEFRTTVLTSTPTRVYPVEVRDSRHGREKRVIRFSDGNGTEIYVNPRYVGTLAATKRVGKEPVKWYHGVVQGTPILRAENGRDIGFVAGEQAPEEEAEWSFRYGPIT